jgi:toxin ParE1/3/4
MGRIIQSPAAQADIDEIAAYVSRDSLEAALRLIDTFGEKFELLSDFPGAGPAREELGPGLRSFPVGNYVIFYRKLSDGIELVRVLHGARNLRKLFRRDSRT